MNQDNLIIEDFDFSQYPVTRIYPLGDKTVIQIGESSNTLSKRNLIIEVEELKDVVSILEKENKELEEATDEAQSKFEKLDNQMDESFDLLEKLFGFTPDFGVPMTVNLSDLRDHINRQERSKAQWEDLEEQIAGLELDNRALADTIERQDFKIEALEQELANWQIAYPNG